MSGTTDIRPFRIAIPQADLDDLQERLARTRWTSELRDAGADYGVSLAQVQQWATYWRTRFDWRAAEAKLNAYPQFTTTIDGQNVHFLHVRSATPGARLGLILTHGWPGSVLEYLDVLEPLTAAGFDLVIPSVPGCGFSGPTTARGWDLYRIARAWVELMRRLGYDRYGAVGNDGGSMISPLVGRIDPEHVVGVHVTQIYAFPSGAPGEFDQLSEADRAAVERLNWFWQNKGAFNQVLSQSPQNIAHALADSPVALLGWNGQLLGGLDDEFVVANAATYWLTGTSGSAMRLYYEMARSSERPGGPTSVPIALCGSTNDFLSVRRFAERDHANIASWNVYDAPGHYTAHQRPEIVVADMRQFFAGLAQT